LKSVNCAPPVSEEILSSGNANPLEGTAATKTVAEMIALDFEDALIFGRYYEVSGTLELRGSYDNVWIVDGDDAITFYYKSDPASIAALEAQVGMDVTLTVVYYAYKGAEEVIVTYDGGEDGISINALPDDEALAADIAAINSQVPGVTLESIMLLAEGVDLVPAATVAGITLPAVGPNGTAFTNWMSDNTDVLGNDGSFVALGATSVVTFTADATKGTETGTVTVEVVVPVLSTVAEVLAMDLGSYFQVTGTVYEISHYGFFIEEAGSYLFIFGQDYTGDVVVGDNITVIAKSGEYSGLLQASPVTDITVNSQGNADVVTPIMGTIEGIEQDLYPRGSRVTITGTVSIEGTYDNVFLTGAAGGHIGVYYRSNADEIAYVDDSEVQQGLVGQTVTLTVVLYQNASVLFQGVTADITTAATGSALSTGNTKFILRLLKSPKSIPSATA